MNIMSSRPYRWDGALPGARVPRRRPEKSSRFLSATCREPLAGFVPGMSAAKMGCTPRRRSTMAKYLMLKHYSGAPEPVNCIPMSEWTPQEINDHVRFMQDFAAR